MIKVSSFEAVMNGGDDESKLLAWCKKALSVSFTTPLYTSKTMQAVVGYSKINSARVRTPRTPGTLLPSSYIESL